MLYPLRHYLLNHAPHHVDTLFDTLSTNRLVPRDVSLWAKEEPMKPIRVPALDPEQLAALENLY
ncbi:MAG: hypothetical protein M3479_10745, partial [Actinomycetota bacterium]|nr:hypothetical protein [Actinomycetota bacterium]